ncbi:MAG: type II toxin-antitoxin system HicB family antitoxin [Gemmataceae bacterium]
MSEARAGRRSTDNPTILRLKGEWRHYNGGVYRYMVYLTAKEEGGFSAAAARLPGVASHGSTEQETLANIVEAFKGAIARYKELGVDIPWTKTPVEPESGAGTRWVIVRL